MVDIAKRKADEREINNVTFTKTSIFDKEFKEDFFDAILAFNILHCLESVEEAINRVKCLLKPNGLFISVTPSTGNRKKSVKEAFNIL
jgi:2-polyprenyl-3-methyl-5-hydroxy-6-metoxy-1,4-benzoquinol methylase